MTQATIDGISVILPTYNGEENIGNAVRSILDQDTSVPIELIIVDDGSSDKTIAIIESIQDDRIKLIFTTKNVGTAAARNLGIQYAYYNWLGFNDHDDVWLPDRITAQVALLGKYPQLRGVAGGYARLAKDGASRWEANLLFKRWSPQHLLPIARPSFYDPAQHGTCHIQALIVEKKLLLDIGGFRENLPIAYDPDIVLRLGEVASLGAIQQPVFLYRLSTHSITAPESLEAFAFLSGFSFCYSAQGARLRGETEPDVETFIKDYVVKEEEVESFTMNQTFRTINTQWVNEGTISALYCAIRTMLMNPLLFIRYLAKRFSYWRKPSI
jgi:glycosyltransferase involved in cell wall biosynthesis